MTAVEFLYERLERMIPRTALYNMDKEEYFKQAKEMEKQQGYSEEDMIEFGKFIFKNTLLVNVKGVEGILKQFKNK
jgi:hypothetical protein